MRPSAAGALERLVAEARWFHAIDFGGLVSKGRFGAEVPPNYTLYGVFELLGGLSLEGARAVDVGTMDGLVAFVMKALGAAEVIATDLAPRETFEAARARLGLAIDYRVPLPVVELPGSLGATGADVVVMAGVLYHVLDPLAVLQACRRSLRPGGFLLVETMYLFDEARPRLSFNPADTSARGVEHANVFWRPSRRALEAMLGASGFDVLASVAVDGRIAVLARARDGSRDGGERGDRGEPSPVRFHGAPGHRRIYPSLHRPRVPFQPAWKPRRTRDRLRHARRSVWMHLQAALAEAREVTRRAR